MTVEEYVLKECRHLPMAIHLDIAKAFRAGQRDVALRVDFTNKNEFGLDSDIGIAVITEGILNETVSISKES